MATRIVLLAPPDRLAPLRRIAAPFWSQAGTARALNRQNWWALSFRLPGQPTQEIGELSSRARSEEVDVVELREPLATWLPGLLVSDVDSTITRTEAIDLLGEAAGRADEVAEVTARAMAGELDFAESLHARVACLEGLPAEAVDEAARATVVTDGARELVQAAHRAGCRFTMVSGGFTRMVEPLARRLGADAFVANDLEIVDGQCTGRVLGEIVDRSAKARYLRRWAEKYDVDTRLTVAIGDGANDLDMMAAAGMSIAFCAKPVVVEAADAAISLPRMDAIPALWARP
ncbi:phosphoserine phosphatase SerB [Acidipropionibacterium acidipropionici]|uniref:phosphoserine phosphatase SerB n=1 Tax=Acidipropionibacterium acidipropionici TaxID=1748 RepID=UPI00040127D6|nr:phosphoserine phosphatase SerB [Acidipropionibacterium acidipropionici]ALN14114.1 phosphoserine phosphatase [Acidipropionibacterium acidipropionici]APZ10121.1 phosphoserine phosphatase SerB [Acidipropionibacterium acidipropionici]